MPVEIAAQPRTAVAAVVLPGARTAEEGSVTIETAIAAAAAIPRRCGESGRNDDANRPASSIGVLARQWSRW